jgi:hypothetical protein
MPRQRRGMLLKNVTEYELDIELSTRTLHFEAGEEHLITPAEVLDEGLRDHLQMRTVAVVRPTTVEEENTLLGRKKIKERGGLPDAFQMTEAIKIPEKEEES